MPGRNARTRRRGGYPRAQAQRLNQPVEAARGQDGGDLHGARQLRGDRTGTATEPIRRPHSTSCARPGIPLFFPVPGVRARQAPGFWPGVRAPAAITPRQVAL